MRPSRRVLKIAAVVSSVTLMGLYVYDRAGGNLIQRFYSGVAAENERPLMSSSKLKQIFKAVELNQQQQTASPKLLPGSKSTVVVETHSESTLPATNVLPPNLPAVPPGTQPRAEQLPPEQPAQPPVMLHGSKSAAPLISAPTPQMVDPQVAPNGPGKRKPPQQGQPAAPPRNNAPNR
jgi:hypothetical protein